MQAKQTAKKPTLTRTQREALGKRFGAIKRWCDGRDITRYASFFSGADPKLVDYSVRMGYVWRHASPRFAHRDLEWIKRCEKVIGLFTQSKAA